MANTKVTGDLLADGTLFARHLNESHGITTSVIGEGTNLYYTNDRVSSYLSSNGYATSTAIIASIVDSAPSTLDTLNELAAALGDDPNFATTVTTAIATKIDGTGTANYLMKWSDSNTATNSVLYDDGTNIGIGVTPSAWNANSRALQLPGFVSLSQQNNGALNLMSYALETSGNTFTYADTGVYPLRYNQNPNNGAHSWYVATTGTAGNAVSFTQAMTLNASGNLSIGNTNNTYKLDVSGTGRFTETIYAGGNIELVKAGGNYILVGEGTGVNQYGAIDWDATNNRLRIATQPYAFGASGGQITLTTDGNVGIGTTSPLNGKLEVKQTSNDTTHDVKIPAVFGPSGYLDSDSPNLFGAGLSETQFTNGTTNRPAVISLGGNLQVNEALGAINFFASNNDANYRSRANIYGGYINTGTAGKYGGDLSFSTAADGAMNPTRRMYITSTGNVEIQSAGELRTYRSDNARYGTFYTDNAAVNIAASVDPVSISSPEYIRLNTAGTERMRITADGKLGINNTSPSNLLTIGADSHYSPSEANRILNWYTFGGELHNSQISLSIGNNDSNTTQPRKVGLALFNNSATDNTYSPAITFGGLSTSGNYMNGSAAIAVQLPANADQNFRGGNLIFYTAGIGTDRGLKENVRIQHNGNVGIGTPTPGQKLDVSGGFAQDGVSRYCYSGYTDGTSSFDIDVSHVSECSLKITCVMNHYGLINNYGCARMSLVANGPTYDVIDITNVTSSNGGSWSFTRINNATLRISKNAGGYGGGGYYFVEVVGKDLT